ncbi:TetR/AcrR family transcriptional regulator [Rhodococcus sp. NPDC127528]|uniref:TetR/AcrR family transcriptional regulator n=1 Tax=unclassified Rhodococcus (in: high G+C Gram-positive bacteria) TaxID=192944 RepID=UPI00364423A5
MTTARPRARLLASTIAIVQELGVNAAGLTELLKRSNASRNSLYQHFPAGKGQLVETATRIVSRLVYSHLNAMSEKLASAPAVEPWLDELFAFWREPLESSEYRLGSFMMAAALDEQDPAVQSAAGQAFTDWTARLAEGMVAAGIEETTARSMAGLLLSVIEGAIVQSRAFESSQPFVDARAQLGVLLGHHLDRS